MLDLLKQAIDEQDHNRAAVAAVVMLAAQVSMQLTCCAFLTTHTATFSLLQDPSYVPGPDMLREARTSQYFPDIAAAALEVLRDQVSTEELKRYMRKLHDHQINPEQAELVTFELVYLLAERVCFSSCCHQQQYRHSSPHNLTTPVHVSPPFPLHSCPAEIGIARCIAAINYFTQATNAGELPRSI